MRMTTSTCRILAPIILSTALASQAALERGEVRANTKTPVTGQTIEADEAINLVVIDSPRGSARASGTMSSVDLNTSANISSEKLQSYSETAALIEFVDSLYVTAEGIEPGTDLIVTVAWNVSGDTSFDSSQAITTRSKIVMTADGIDLDKEDDEFVPKQAWTRDQSNFVPDVTNSFGQVTFEFLIKAETLQEGNIRLRAAAGSVCGGSGSRLTGTYNSSSTSHLNVEFVGATNLKTTDGSELYRWETNARSKLEYGSRDEDAPVIPDLTVGESTGGTSLVRLSWDSSASQYYEVQVSKDDQNWETVTEVPGDGGTVNIDLLRDPKNLSYRLQPHPGSGSGRPFPTPQLMVFKAGDKVRVAFLTDGRGVYSLELLDDSGNTTTVNAALGNGGVAWFDFTPRAGTRLFQVTGTEL